MVQLTSMSVPSTGPEAVAVDEAGRIYTGVKDGSIMRFDTPDSQPAVFSARLPAGRPLVWHSQRMVICT